MSVFSISIKKCNMKKIIMFIHVILSIMLINAEASAIDLEERQEALNGRLYYSGDYSKIRASVVAGIGHSWHIKDYEVASIGSRGGFELTWGKAWYQHTEFDMYSNRSLFPTQIGQGPGGEISYNTIAALLGYPSGWVPSLKYTRTQFYAVGVAEGYEDVYINTTLLSEGDEFDLGLIFDTYFLEWRFGGKKPWGSFGVGVVRTEFLGVETDYDRWGDIEKVTAEKKLEQYGFGFSFSARYKSKAVTSTGVYGNLTLDMAIAADSGVMKIGYETGFRAHLYRKIMLKPYVGGYTWQLKGDVGSKTTYDSRNRFKMVQYKMFLFA